MCTAHLFKKVFSLRKKINKCLSIIGLEKITKEYINITSLKYKTQLKMIK